MGKNNVFLSCSLDKLPPTSDLLVNSNSSIRSRHLSSGSVPVTSLNMADFPRLPPLAGGINSRAVNGSRKSVSGVYPAPHDVQRRSLIEKGSDGSDESSSGTSGRKGHCDGVSVRGYIVLAILLLANLINYMDRYTIAGVLDEVIGFYHIDNASAGLLQTSFIASYMLLSPIFGYLGDRYNRKYIMAAGILFWSFVTLIGSFVPPNHFWAFMILRACVGVGEASYSTIAPTIIADMFSKTMRTTALSIFYFAIPVGSGLGYIVGSSVAAAFGEWQWSLRVTPILGFICTALVLFVVVDPPRGAADGGGHQTAGAWTDDVKHLFRHKSFMLSTFGFTCVAFVAGALALWAPLYLHLAIQVQEFDTSMATVSLIFGIITCLAGFFGVIIGSTVAHYLRRYTPRADALVCAFGLIASAPFLYAALCVSNRSIYATWVLIFIGETFLSLNWALVTDILLYIVIPSRRSMAEAVQILISHALGDAGSPYVVGLISVGIKSSSGRSDTIIKFIALQYSLYMTCFVAVFGGAFFLATAIFLPKDRLDCDKAIKAANSQTVTPDTNDDSGEASSGDSVVMHAVNEKSISRSNSASDTTDSFSGPIQGSETKILTTANEVIAKPAVLQPVNIVS